MVEAALCVAAPLLQIADGLAQRLHVVFLVGAPVAFMAFLLALRLKEIPLRGVTGPTSMQPAGPSEGEELGEALGMPPSEPASV